MIIHGACHCGNIRFSLTWDPDPVKIEDPGRVSCSRRGPASFEGEDSEARLARRRRNWIADVTFR
jgi:hypothetical protein